MVIDLSLSNADLYAGCDIEESGGRFTLTTPAAVAVEILQRNVDAMLTYLPDSELMEVTLTGRMAIWAYLAVGGAVAKRFRRVIYDDGRHGPVVVA